MTSLLCVGQFELRLGNLSHWVLLHLIYRTTYRTNMASKTNRCDVLCHAKEHQDHQVVTSDTVLQETATRPNISYMRLAAMAIDASPDGCCTAVDIYDYIETTFPFYAHTPPRYWKVSWHQSLVCGARVL